VGKFAPVCCTKNYRMRSNSLLAALAFGVVAVTQAVLFSAETRAEDNWRTYHNDRYGTTIEYPDIFKPGTPPDNDDGLAFKSADGADFSVFASYNALDFDLTSFQEFAAKNLDAGSAVTYRTHGVNWFVLSGTKGDGIFYQRNLLSHGGQMTEGFVMNYPARLKETYDPIVARMAKSFRPGSGYQTPSEKR
jgi:hypothetical protein